MNEKKAVSTMRMYHISPAELLYLRMRLPNLGVWSIVDEGFLTRRDAVIAELAIDSAGKEALEQAARQEGFDCYCEYLNMLLEVTASEFWSCVNGILEGAGVRRAIEVRDDEDLAVIEDPGGGVRLAGAADSEADQGAPVDDEEIPF